MIYFLPFLAASRLTLYAIATACFAGFPALISAFTLLRNADLLVDLTRGTFTGPFSSVWAENRLLPT